MKKNLAYILLLLLVLLASRWLVHKYRRPGSMTVLESQTMNMDMKAPAGTAPVALEELSAEFLQPSATFTGSVRAWGDEEVVARVSGRVLRMPVYPGDRVHAGQLLVQLDSEELRLRAASAAAAGAESEYRSRAAHRHHERGQLELRSIEAELRQARLNSEQAASESVAAAAELKFREAEFYRSNQLYEQGGLSLEELQKARAELAESRSRQRVKQLEVARAQAGIRKVDQQRAMQVLEARVFEDESRAQVFAQQKQQAESMVADTIEGYTRLTALSEGVVAERLVSPGTLVQPGTLLLRLRSTHKLRLQARVPQEYSGQLGRGSRVTVNLPGRDPLVTEISSDFSDTDPNTRTFTVEAVISGSSGLRVGAYVPMEIALAKRKRRLTVPLASLQRDLSNQPFVWIAASTKGGLKASKRPVKVSGAQDGRVGISEGVRPGEKVVVAGGFGLRDGMALSEVNWSTQGPETLPPPSGKMPEMEGMEHSSMPGLAPAEEYCSPTPGAAP
ncbi:MAG: efflux RND transporter periplasmic adaptor subunit [Vulcanimicrobiota bacterium]